jgi:hypothetical protein
MARPRDPPYGPANRMMDIAPKKQRHGFDTALFLAIGAAHRKRF